MSYRKDSGSRRQRAKGRSGHGDRFARLPHAVLESVAYRSLSCTARALLIELVSMENGRNNGIGLFLSVRDAADQLGLSDLTAASRAFKELEVMGLIAKTAEAHFAIKASAGSRARYWRLTWEAVAGRIGPTRDFETRKPLPRTRASKRSELGNAALRRWKRTSANESAVLDFDTLNPRCVQESQTPAPDTRFTVAITDTQRTESGSLSGNAVASNSTTYTADQGARAFAEATGRLPAISIADQIKELWNSASAARRARASKQAGLQVVEVERYLKGDMPLATIKMVAIRGVLRS